MNFREAVYRLVSLVPAGKVMTYGQVATSLGSPRASRAVGTALHLLPDPAAVPWWRVINRHGQISTRCSEHPAEFQLHLLMDEGIDVDGDGVISLERFRWWPSGEVEAQCQPDRASTNILEAGLPGLKLSPIDRHPRPSRSRATAR